MVKSNIRDIDLNLNSFVPLFKFETAHTQTLLGHLLKSDDFVQSHHKELLTLSDGDTLGLVIFENKTANRKNAVVAVFHGLGGSHKSDYIQRTAQIAFDQGFHVVLVDHRGSGEAVGLAKKPYHSGRGEDASAVSQRLRNLFLNCRQIFIGYSMSGSILLNLATLRSGQNLPDACIVVNAPINLSVASQQLSRGFSKIYDIRFYFLLKKLISKNTPNEKLPFFGATALIDDLITSKKSGFIDRADYYAKCSTKNYLKDIAIPTFLLTSQDDPFILFEDYQNINWNKNTHTTFVRYGGHMGYISKNHHGAFGVRWMDYYLDQVLARLSTAICS